MKALALFRSFAGGEITPELYGRLDLSKYQTGLALCRNMQVLPHGPAVRRSGLRYSVETNKGRLSAVRAIPFEYSTTQSAVLEFGDLYIGFLVNGAPVLEASSDVLSVVGPLVTTVLPHGYTTGDDVFIGGRTVRTVVLNTTQFNTVDFDGVTLTEVSTASETVARLYRIASPYLAADLFDLHYAQDSDVITITHPSYATRELRRLGATNWTLTTITFAPTMTVPGGVGVVATVGTPGNQNPHSYVVTAIAADGITESLASSVVSANNNLTVSGNFNTISWSAVVGASRYYVYKRRGGSFGFIGQTTTLSVVDDNVLADTTKTPPEDIIDLNDTATRQPAATAYHEQRRWFAGTTDEPQTVWATRIGTQSNLTSSIPSQDDDGMKFRIASRQQNAIRHLVPLQDMIAFTVGGEFRIFADGAPAITPTSLSIKTQGYSGASNVQPAVTSGSILFIQNGGARVRELAYNWQQSAYASVDLSIMAPHLFNNYTMKDIAFTRAPEPALWCVRGDGVLLGLTYVPEQQVYAWHQHTTDGTFESVCVVREASGDVLYAVVRRTINGSQRRYIERMDTRFFATQSDAFFVDSGLTYSGAPLATFSGLNHLEGKTVQILSDGAVHPDRVVTGGVIALEEPASVVHVGLKYVSDFQTLPIAFEGAPAGGQGVRKNINGVRVRVTETSVVKAGPSFDRLTENRARDVDDDYDTPPPLLTQEVRFSIGPSWNSDGAVCIRQDLPLPLTVLSMVLDASVGG